MRISIVDDYINRLIARVQSEKLGDDTVAVALPEASGVVGFGASLDAAIDDLRGRLREWVHVFHNRGYALPVVAGIDLDSPENRLLVDYDNHHPQPPAGEFFEDEEAFGRALERWAAEADAETGHRSSGSS